jgi:hypothetical protein
MASGPQPARHLIRGAPVRRGIADKNTGHDHPSLTSPKTIRAVRRQTNRKPNPTWSQLGRANDQKSLIIVAAEAGQTTELPT